MSSMKRLSAMVFSAACVAGLSGTAFAQGDVVLSDSTSVQNYGVVGSIRAYAIQSNTCNIGTGNILWTNNGTPGLAMNLYRIHNGRLMQIGMSWVKAACCAAAQGSYCQSRGAPTACNGAAGSQLGAGCLDVYTASWNGGQGRLGPRSAINPWTGTFGPIPSGTNNAVSRRLQVNTADLNTTTFAGAQWLIEGVYVATDDAGTARSNNNASYKRVLLDGATGNLTPTGNIEQGIPAIRAWRDHGNGANTPNNDVQFGTADVPSEGRFWHAHTVRQINATTWRYEYAVFNLNSHISAGSFSVPVPAGVTVSNVGFNAPDYQTNGTTGDNYSNADWVVTQTGGNVTWSSPQTFAQNPNTNALRWGTMYNFWFDADTAPTAANASLGLFRTSGSLTIGMRAPSPVPQLCDSLDFNLDGDFPTPLDTEDFINAVGGNICSTCSTDLDFNNDGDFPTPLDIEAFISVSSGGPCIR